MTDLARVRVLYEELVDLDGAELSARLAAIADEDPALHAELASLLDHMGTQAAGLDDLAGVIDRTALDRVLDETRDAGQPGDVDGFHVVRLVAAGGMGRVYEAEQLSPKRRVALKVLHADLARPQMLRRFRREAEILGLLGHPGIAQIHELGTMRTEHGERPYFVMEYVDGASLTEHAREQGLDTNTRLELFARVCDAVQHAHDHGVIHRDLKPDNILVDARGDPKVLDFGVARVTESDLQPTTLVTEVGQVMGTLPYMSPEQVAGNPDDIDVRSDVYALGVVLFELLSGSRPHELAQKSLPDAARIIREEDATRLGSVSTRWRGDVETIVGKALEKDPARRYASADALAADVRRHLSNQPITAHAPSRFYLLRKFAQRHTGLVVGSSLAVVALVVGLAFSLKFALDEAAQRRAAEVTSYRALVTAATASLDSGELLAARGILDQTDEALRGWEWHHASARAEPLMWERERALIHPEDSLTHTRPSVFSLDDTRLAAPIAEDRVGVFDAAAGALLFEFELTGDLAVYGLEATSQGFLTCTRDGHVVHWDGATGEPLAEDRMRGPIHTMVWDETHGRLAAATRLDGEGEGDERLYVGPLGALEVVDHTPFLLVPVADRKWHNQNPVGWCRGGETLVGQEGTLVDIPVRADGGPGVPRVRSTLDVYAVEACREDRLIVMADRYRAEQLTVIDLDGEVLVDLEAQMYPHTGRAGFSRDGTRISVGSWLVGRLMVTVHDAATGRALSRWPSEKGTRGELSATGRWLALGSADDLRLVSLEDSAMSVLSCSAEYVYEVAWTPDGRTLLSRSMDFMTRGHDVVEESVLFDVANPGHAGDAYGLATTTWGIASDGIRLVESCRRFAENLSDDRTMALATRDLVAGGPWQDVPGVGWKRERAGSMQMLFDMPRASRLEFLRATGAIGPSTADAAALQLTRATTSAPRVLVAPSGTRLVDAFALSIEPLDDAGPGRVPLEWPSREEPLDLSGVRYADAHFSPDGRLLAAARAGLHEGVVIHDTTSGAAVVELLADLETRPVFYAVAFSPDGERLAVGGTDRVVRLFDTNDWTLVSQLEGHESYVKDIGWSPDGATLATAGGDGTVRLWHTATLAERTAAAHAAAVRREQQRPAVTALFARLDDPHAAAAAVRADPSLDDDERHAALRCVRELADAWWARR